MKKVLFVAGKMVHGGLEIMLMNFYRNIDKSKVHIDFMLHHPEKGAFDDEIIKSGGKIFIMPKIVPKNIFKYIGAVNRFFREHRGEYDVVHGHLTSVGIIYLTIAKMYGVKTRVIHAHYANVVGNHYEKIERIMLKPLRFSANWYFACSEKAGRFCFGDKIADNKEKFHVIHNGIDVGKFSYNESVRNKIRKSLKVEDKQVLLHVGRFQSEKNHKFMVEIMEKSKDNNVVMIFVGAGPLEDEIKQLVAEKNLNDKIKFLGLRDDIYEIMQGADVFLLPSIFEGLPVVGVESQGSGLPCIFSDTVTKEVDITGNSWFLPITDPSAWVDKISELKSFKREKTDKLLIDAGFDIRAQAKILEKFYLEGKI